MRTRNLSQLTLLIIGLVILWEVTAALVKTNAKVNMNQYILGTSTYK